jgi:hypothetical protein
MMNEPTITVEGLRKIQEAMDAALRHIGNDASAMPLRLALASNVGRIEGILNSLPDVKVKD